MTAEERDLLTEAAKSLSDLLEQFRAYQNGWLGVDERGANRFGIRIGLPDDLARAAECKAKIEKLLAADTQPPTPWSVFCR